MVVIVLIHAVTGILIVSVIVRVSDIAVMSFDTSTLMIVSLIAMHIRIMVTYAHDYDYGYDDHCHHYSYRHQSSLSLQVLGAYPGD